MTKRGFVLFSLLGVALCSLVWQSSSSAQVCAVNDPQAALLYLRRLSVDLRGVLPTPAESQAVIKAGKVTSAMIDDMLKSKDFLTEVRRYHKDLLWANINGFRFRGEWNLREDGVNKPMFVADRGEMYRGGEDVGCLDEPAQRGSDGKWRTKTDAKDPKIRREGYVMIRPYWSPEKEVKVCAFDAEAAATYKDSKDNKNKSCKYTRGNRACGCGPNLQWCQAEKYGTGKAITSSFLSQMMHDVEILVKENRRYTEVLNGKGMSLNGPLSHFLRHQVQTVRDVRITGEQDMKIATVAFAEKDKWITVTRGPLHAGVLTMPVFLLKFASNRGRANRFYESFLCKSFQAPPGGLPPGQDTCHKQPNLMKRCGCKFCHVTLEPAASYWGRWVESGVRALSPKNYPRSLTDIPRERRNSSEFRNLYLTRPKLFEEEEYRNDLKAYLFATKEMVKNIEQGPLKLANTIIQDGRFANCTTNKVWKWFVGEHSPLSSKQRSALVETFKKSNYSFRALVKAVVLTESYRMAKARAAAKPAKR